MTDVTGSRPSLRLDWLVSQTAPDFVAANRHSVWVRVLRRAIIVGAVLSVAVLTAIPLFDPFQRLPKSLSISGVGLDGTRVTLDLPKMSGIRADGLPYQVRARAGVQDTRSPDIVELNEVDADVSMADATTAHITAITGIYDGDKDHMALRGDVHIKNSSGYEIRMRTAQMNFKSGNLASDEPVDVLLDSGSIAADSMDMSDNGHKISFDGGVHSLFDVGDKTSDAETVAAK